MAPNVLIVDDSAMVRRQVCAALQANGYGTLEAGNGIEALERLKQDPSTCLIVCDVNMPGMNGIELLEQLSSLKSRVPVVMLTTEGEPELIRRATALGAKGWLMKPFKPEFLISTIKKLLTQPA